MGQDELIKAILGLVVLLALAYLGGHPRVQALEKRIGISGVVAAGLPFALLGLLAAHPSVGVLSPPVLHEIRPLLPLGLGWVGFAVGTRFDLRRLDALEAGTTALVALSTGVPFAAIAVVTAPLLLAAGGHFGDLTFLRDALVLGTAGVTTARGAVHHIVESEAETDRADRVARLIGIQELAALVGLVFLGAFFRPQANVAWQLPGVGWLFITLGLGLTSGLCVFALLRSARGHAELNVITIGSVAFTAGMASFLRLSPVVVGALAGAVLVNLPGEHRGRLTLALAELERPIFLAFLLVAGALWRVESWQGWALAGLFVVGRLGGKWLGIVLAERLGMVSTDEGRRVLGFPSIGALSIAIVVSAQDLYSGPTVSWIVTAVLGGAIATEIAAQLGRMRGGRASSAPGGAPC